MKKLLMLCISSMSLLACVEEIDIDAQRDRSLVLNAMLCCSDTVQTLSLTYNNALGDFSTDAPEDAVVKLFCEDVLVGEYTKISYSGWRLKYKPEFNKTYRIVAEVEGAKPLISYTKTPGENAIMRVPKAFDYQSGRVHRFVQFSFSDPYWIYSCYAYNYPDWLFDLDPQFPIRSLPPAVYLSDEIGTNHKYADDFNLTGKEALCPIHQSYIRIPAKDSAGNHSFEIETSNPDAFIIFRAASKEYDTYMKSSLKKASLFNEEYDISRWFDESVVYSNVSNGLGVFASYSDTVYYIPDYVE